MNTCIRTKCQIVVGFLVSTAGAGSGAAMAAGFYSPYQSATAAGTAFAGATARADDPGFFLYNPAAIAGLSKRQSWSDVRFFLPEATITPDAAFDPLGNPLTGAGDSGNLADPAAALGSVTVIPIMEGLNFGLGSSAPFATKTATDPNWGGRFHLHKSEMVGINATGALTWQATPWLALAAGMQIQRFDADFENNAIVPTPGGLVETRAYLDGDPDWGAGMVAGLVLTPAEGTRIGLSWRSQMTHEIEGVARTDLPSTPVEHLSFDVELPQVVSAGLEQRVSSDLRVFAELQWIEWSRFKGFDISFRSGRPNEVREIEWQDTWLYAAGIGYKVTPSIELTAGASFESAAAVNGSGTTLSADAEKTTVGIGLLTDVKGIGRVSMSYAHVFVHEAPVLAANPASGTMEGRLDGRLDTFGASLTIPW